ncbi:MAG: hypothetical protein R6W83_04650 [Cryobacterium sp.]
MDWLLSVDCDWLTAAGIFDCCQTYFAHNQTPPCFIHGPATSHPTVTEATEVLLPPVECAVLDPTWMSSDELATLNMLLALRADRREEKPAAFLPSTELVPEVVDIAPAFFTSRGLKSNTGRTI